MNEKDMKKICKSLKKDYGIKAVILVDEDASYCWCEDNLARLMLLRNLRVEDEYDKLKAKIEAHELYHLKEGEEEDKPTREVTRYIG